MQRLVRDHIMHLERPFSSDAALGKFIIRLMPQTNGAEGRLLIKELTDAGTLGNTSTVIERCTRIVHESQAPMVCAAGAVVPAAAAAEWAAATLKQRAANSPAEASSASIVSAVLTALAATGHPPKSVDPPLAPPFRLVPQQFL